MKQYKLTVGVSTTILCISLLLSCVKDSELNLPVAEPAPVVNCLLNADEKVQKLSLTWSKTTHTDNVFEEITSAEITLYQATELIGKFKKTGKDTWEIEHTPQPGKQYKLTVDVPNYKQQLSAETTIPLACKIEQAGTADNGHTKLFKQTSGTSKLWFFGVQSYLQETNPAQYPTKVEDDPDARLMLHIGTNHKNADSFNQRGQFVDIDPEYGNTLSYLYYVRVPENNAITAQNPYPFTVQLGATPVVFVVFRCVSNELDLYFKSVIEKKNYYETEDGQMQWFDEMSTYTNIRNGLGIFGAYTQDVFYYNNLSE